MAEPLKLEILTEKTLPQTANPRQFTYSPALELVAITSTDQQVLIYRLNGQRVYGTGQKGASLKVESIRWKPDGLSRIEFFMKLRLTFRQANFLLLPGAMDRFDW
jgi:anaphase-promoting complex subunit 4